MGGIQTGHVEWAIINRLKAMLDDPPETKFNVTQTLAVFSTVLLWTKNRGWVAGNNATNANIADAADKAAHAFRLKLGKETITAKPWSLPLFEPKLTVISDEDGRSPAAINGDFREMPVENFIKWMRDALGHGDGRTIRPLHKAGKYGANSWLAGFEVNFNETRGSERILHLQIYDADMRRIGSMIADRFCQSLADDPHYYEEDVATRVMESTDAA